MFKSEEVWYLDDSMEVNWKVVMTMARRDHFGVYFEYQEAELYSRQNLDEQIVSCDQDIGWVNERIEGTIVDEHNFRFDTQDMMMDY
ncbi:hypothetical protein LIER_43873 [Lithospermum erythrorhizon]|uniref:Uncharacterized protein n=1 Tax=Lithospermum erythrorhizon TaxID=34254 RepID=A0AAV3R285_LITER